MCSISNSCSTIFSSVLPKFLLSGKHELICDKDFSSANFTIYGLVGKVYLWYSSDLNASFIFCKYSLPLVTSIQVVYGMGKSKVKSTGYFSLTTSLSNVVTNVLLGNTAPTYIRAVAKHGQPCIPKYLVSTMKSFSSLLLSIRNSHCGVNIV